MSAGHHCATALLWLRDGPTPGPNSIPDGYFSIPLELFKALYNLEALLNQTLDSKAKLEISVGRRWAIYAQAELGLSDQARRRYTHQCQDGRVVSAWTYPLRYVAAFDRWLWNTYIPEQFPAYCRYRSRRIGQPMPIWALKSAGKTQQLVLW